MYTSKFRICRILVLAGFTWLVTVIVLFYYWELIMEHQGKLSMKFSKNPVDEDNEKDFHVSTEENFTQIHISKSTKITTTAKRKIFPTISSEIYKRLGLSQNVGENGVGVRISDPPPDIKERIDSGWKKHEFNEFLSDLISVNRTVPDPRAPYCTKDAKYLEHLPMTSVIVIFHNEAWSTLLRTVHSVINRSPDHLIKEIILVDDYSNMRHLKEQLESYMSYFPKVKIVRMEKRVGLIKARIAGTEAATAETLTFLDSHVECAEGWLEPLLDRIARDSSNVATPVIDVIDDETLQFSYQDAQSLQVGGFDWEMTFDWHMVPEKEKLRKKDPSEPTRSPTMAGGLFTIQKKFFERLGMYDPGFDIWGAENLELSFKTWMCGGTLEIIPCSHVGHIFRKKSPYKWRPGVDVLKLNTIRLIEVWLDEYGKYYYLRRGSDKGNFGDISERVQLRKNLQCKSFKWYLENVYPEMSVPDNFAEGWIKNKALDTNLCLDLALDESKTDLKVEIYGCHGLGGNQFFEYTKKFEVKRASRCMDFNSLTSNLIFYPCHLQGGSQKWLFNITTSQFYHESSNKCVSIHQNQAVMEACDGASNSQKWTFQYLYENELKNKIN